MPQSLPSIVRQQTLLVVSPPAIEQIHGPLHRLLFGEERCRYSFDHPHESLYSLLGDPVIPLPHILLDRTCYDSTPLIFFTTHHSRTKTGYPVHRQGVQSAQILALSKQLVLKILSFRSLFFCFHTVLQKLWTQPFPEQFRSIFHKRDQPHRHRFGQCHTQP